MSCVLFLDDDPDRHARFRARVEQVGYARRHRMLYAFSAAEAIAALDAHAGELVRAFLDHDLSIDDVLVEVGAPSTVPTGMAVVDHIVTMQRPPAAVVVHSLNEAAAIEMCARLNALGTIDVNRIPFSLMLSLLT